MTVYAWTLPLLEHGAWNRGVGAVVALTRDFLEKALVWFDNLQGSDFIEGLLLPTDGLYYFSGGCGVFHHWEGDIVPNPRPIGKRNMRRLNRVSNNVAEYQIWKSFRLADERCLMTRTGLSWQALILNDTYFRTSELSFKGILREMKGLNANTKAT
jgi:hypothetical protein